MKKITIFFNIINYVVCDFAFATKMGIIRLFPLYWIYKIAAKYKVTKIERPLYKYLWWVDTDGLEKKFKRETTIYFFRTHNSDRIFAILYFSPVLLSIAVIISHILKIDLDTTVIVLLCPAIIVYDKAFKDEKTKKYFKIFNRIRSRHINKWRIMAIITLISGIILLNYINRIMVFLLKNL